MKNWQIVFLSISGCIVFLMFGLLIGRSVAIDEVGTKYITRSWSYTDTRDEDILLSWDKGTGRKDTLIRYKVDITNRDLYVQINGMRNQINEMQKDLNSEINRARNDTANIMSTQKEIIDKLARIEATLFGK